MLIGVHHIFTNQYYLKCKKRPARRIAKRDIAKFDKNEAELLDIIAQLIVQIIMEEENNDTIDSEI